jgi:hypothetical protein
MTANWMRTKTDTLLDGILVFSATAAQTMRTIVRKAARSKWPLLLTIAVGTLLAFVALKLMALLGSAFDISFLRDVGSNAGPGAAAGGAGAGLGGGAAGGGGNPPGRPPPWKGPYQGPPTSDGMPPRRAFPPGPLESAGVLFRFCQGIQTGAHELLNALGADDNRRGSSGSASKA